MVIVYVTIGGVSACCLDPPRASFLALHLSLLFFRAVEAADASGICRSGALYPHAIAALESLQLLFVRLQ